ncbi:MAG: NUDIX hydrolase [Gammaproteobacteria bacterium]|nr:NUDIX hydrolase [Gammaproteobacteria bacterium]
MRAPEQTFSYRYPHPAVTTDVVVFTIRDGRLCTLLVKRANAPYQGSWALPGGFLDIDEDLDACAERELAEETGLTDVYLEQLFTFGRTDRDPRERVISVTYYALVPQHALSTPRAASDAAAVGWFAFEDLPELAFDHAEIIDMAHRRLVAKLDYSTIAFQFMPEAFTLSELQCVYESLLNQPLDKRNFRKRILSLDLIEETGCQRRTGKHRPAREYRVKHPDRVEIIK